MSTRHLAFVAIVGGMLCASHASAQTASPQATTDRMQFQIVPYLWGSGIDGPVGIGDRTADLDASFDDLLGELQFAAMALADARRDRFVVLTDVLYMNLGEIRGTPGPLFSSVDPQQKTFILTPVAGYRVLDTADASVDVVGGIRYWHLETELQFEAGVLPDLDLEDSRGWVDGIVGVRARRVISPAWSVSAYGDLGAGGSDFTYQLNGNASWAFHQRFALDFGYRILSVDYDNDGLLFDPTLQGPLVGVAIKF